MQIEQYTIGGVVGQCLQKYAARIKWSGAETVGIQQPLDSLKDGFVIVYDGDNLRYGPYEGRTVSLTTIPKLTLTNAVSSLKRNAHILGECQTWRLVSKSLVPFLQIPSGAPTARFA